MRVGDETVKLQDFTFRLHDISTLYQPRLEVSKGPSHIQTFNIGPIFSTLLQNLDWVHKQLWFCMLTRLCEFLLPVDRPLEPNVHPTVTACVNIKPMHFMSSTNELSWTNYGLEQVAVGGTCSFMTCCTEQTHASFLASTLGGDNATMEFFPVRDHVFKPTGMVV